MRYLLCALLLGGSMLAQDSSSQPPASTGMFYVDGIVYQYSVGINYTVVAAAHKAINHKFVALKIRVYNGGSRSISVKPADVLAEDAVTGHPVVAVSSSELAMRMRRTYNMPRLAVSPAGGDGIDGSVSGEMLTPQLLEMMRAMSARSSSGNLGTPTGKNVLYTDTPGALEARGASSASAVCDQVCHLRSIEADGRDMLAQLQRQNTPDYVEGCGFRANTIPPLGNVAGVFFYPIGKLAQSPSSSAKGRKVRQMRIILPVGGDNFQFVLPVE